MRKKQMSLSHSSTESEIISLDASLRMDGIPALDLWDVVTEKSHSSKNTHQAVKDHCRKVKVNDQVLGNRARGEIRSTNPKTKLKCSGNRDVDELSNVDHVVPNASSSEFEVHLYTFENYEAVIKMIIMGRSPTARHVSRTHRVALGWLFDRVNLDPKIQIKYVDTKNQLADMVIKGNFTRDDRNHFLRLFNIMNFSMFSCGHSPSIKKPNTMSKRAQERRTGEEPVVAKSKPASLVSRNLSAKQSPPRWIRVRHTTRRIKDWVGILFSQALRDRCETEFKTKQNVSRVAKRCWSVFQALGNQCGR